MLTRTFTEWFGAIIESPIPVVGKPLAKLRELEILFSGKSVMWDELLREQLERVKKDPVLLSNATSRAQVIHDRISRFEAVPDDLWPDNQNTFVVTLEILRATFERERDEYLLEMSPEVLEKIEQICKESGLDFESFIAVNNRVLQSPKIREEVFREIRQSGLDC